MNAMIYAAGLAAILTAGVIHTVIATRELLGCGKEMSAWEALKIGLRFLPVVVAATLIGTGYAAYTMPAGADGTAASGTATVRAVGGGTAIVYERQVPVICDNANNLKVFPGSGVFSGALTGNPRAVYTSGERRDTGMYSWQCPGILQNIG